MAASSDWGMAKTVTPFRAAAQSTCSVLGMLMSISNKKDRIEKIENAKDA